MIDIKYQCPGCSRTLLITDPQVAGKMIRCPKCKETSRVPSGKGKGKGARATSDVEADDPRTESTPAKGGLSLVSCFFTLVALAYAGLTAVVYLDVVKWSDLTFLPEQIGTHQFLEKIEKKS